MKKAELILGGISLLAIVSQIFHLPGSGVITVLSISSLALLYMYLSFAFFNEIELKKIFKKQSYEGVSAMRIVGAIGAGFAITSLTIGILFKLQSYPGADMNLKIGLGGAVIVLSIGAFKFFKSKSEYYTKIFKRIAVYGGLALLILAMPSTMWTEIKYRDFPEYIKAVNAATADPYNEELWDKVEEEREKMYGNK